MFCGNCGAQNADNAAFCKNCGAQLNAAPQQQPQQPVYQQPVYQQQYYAAPKKPLNTKLIGMIAGAAAAVALVVVLLIVLLGGGGGVAGSPEEVVGNYIDAMVDYDTDGLLALVPDAALDYAAQNEGYDDIDELREEMKAGEDAMEAMMDMLDDYDISYEVIDVTNYKKLDLQDVQECYEDEFELEVTAAAVVTVEITIEASAMGQTMSESDEMDIPVVEIDGNWYLDITEFELSGLSIF